MRRILTFFPLGGGATCLAGLLAACGGAPQGFGDAAISSDDGAGGMDTAPAPGSDASSGDDVGSVGMGMDATVGTDGGNKGIVEAGPDAHDGGAVAAEAGTDSGGPGTTSQKRGLAYGATNSADLTVLSKSISWWYDWGPSQSTSAAGVEFVPMVWNGNFTVSQVESQIPAGAKYLLGFNEPEDKAQANLTPQQAASLWPKIEQIASARGLKIVSPAVNYCGGNCTETSPYTWLSDFFAACQGCQVDYIAVHTYVCTGGSLKNYLSTFETMFKKPIWLTEFSCLDGSLPATLVDEEQYMTQALQVLEADPMIFRYAWFTGRASGGASAVSLLAGTGVLTALGQEYVTLPPPK